ncbi:MAG: hypothetical protein WB562_17375, partial [Candidatus Sulfotelmatobacter sp.]
HWPVARHSHGLGQKAKTAGRDGIGPLANFADPSRPLRLRGFRVLTAMIAKNAAKFAKTYLISFDGLPSLVNAR